jgi:hypothetical protein
MTGCLLLYPAPQHAERPMATANTTTSLAPASRQQNHHRPLPNKANNGTNPRFFYFLHAKYFDNSLTHMWRGYFHCCLATVQWNYSSIQFSIKKKTRDENGKTKIGNITTVEPLITDTLINGHLQ